MTRTRLVPLLAALATFALVAAPAPAQDGPGRRGDADGTLEESPRADVFRAILEAVRGRHLDDLSDSTIWKLAIDGFIDELDDPYAAVLTPDEYESFEEETTGNYAGIGVAITRLDDAITITAVFRGTPADDSGLQVGDRIVGVNGESTEGWSTADAASEIRGPRGTAVELRIGRDGYPKPFPQTVRRDEVHISAVTATGIDDDLGYIGLDRVARSSGTEVDSALTELRDAGGLIFDLRRNPGGFLDEGIRVADIFLRGGKRIASVRGRRPEWEQAFDARTPSRLPRVPIVVLVDGYTASAAEIVAGALQDHDRALVVGSRTFGKGLVQTLVPLPHDYRIRITTGSWYTPLGRSLHRARDEEGRLVPEDPDTLPTFTSPGGRTLEGGGGVIPDVVVEADTFTTAEQELLNASAEAEVPLATRIVEEAFDIVEEEEERAGPSASRGVGDARFRAFLDGLVDEGMPEERVWTDGARRHLRWRIDVALAERRDDYARALRLRMERDPVLAEAVRRLRDASTQADLFAHAPPVRPVPAPPDSARDIR